MHSVRFIAVPFSIPKNSLFLSAAVLEGLNLNYLKAHGWVPIRES